MSNTAIVIEDLSKRYRIGLKEDRHDTIVGAGLSWIKSPFSNYKKVLKLTKFGENGEGEDIIWALRNVSFEVKHGEVIGIIGRNGAGKSTLLKIISRITEPTSGKVILNGRVSSLLEVGTGFHPELTGRENIYLNGAVLGMSKAEIQRKFDQIVAFSGIEKFIDTPVKRYSSGMKVRLAFSVAAHLEPEIMLIDEVLAVGDAAFQKKCLGKMEDISREGRTVLFVSHNMAAVEALCTGAFILVNGNNSGLQPANEAVKAYLRMVNEEVDVPAKDRKDRVGRRNVRFKEVSFLGGNGGNTYSIGEDITIRMIIENHYSTDILVRLSLSVRTTNEVPLISCDSKLKGKLYKLRGLSATEVLCTIGSPLLNYGDYWINVAVFDGGTPEDWITSVAKFTIESGQFDEQLQANPFPVLAKFEWSLRESNPLSEQDRPR